MLQHVYRSTFDIRVKNMTKQKLTLTVDSEVIERAKSMEINISEITEELLHVWI